MTKPKNNKAVAKKANEKAVVLPLLADEAPASARTAAAQIKQATYVAPKTFKKTLREAGVTFKWLIGCTHDDQLTHVHFGPDMRGSNSATMKLVSPSQVMAAFSQEPIVSDWLSPHTVKWGLGPMGPLEMLYFKPARMRFIGLRDAIFKDIVGAEFVNDRVIFEVPMPGLLWVGSGKDYKIYATSSKDFHDRMPLFKTPLPNVFDTHGICWGQNDKPAPGQGGAMQAWQVFWNSPFTGAELAGKSKQSPRDIRYVLAQIAARKAYPVDDLVVLHGKTPENVLADWLDPVKER